LGASHFNATRKKAKTLVNNRNSPTLVGTSRFLYGSGKEKMSPGRMRWGINW